MAISENTFARACEDPEYMIKRAAFYRESSGFFMEVLYFFEYLFTAGNSEERHEKNENSKLTEFVAIIKDAETEVEVQQGNYIVLEVKSPNGGTLLLKQSKLYGEDVLDATFNGVKFSTGEINTIAKIKQYIRTNLNKNEGVAASIVSGKEAATNIQNQMRAVLATRRLKELAKRKEEKPVVDIQRRIRGILATRRKEKEANVPALRDDKGIAIAYKVKPERNEQGLKQYPWVRMPPKIVDPAKLNREGTNKKLTHENDQYVGFTLNSTVTITVSQETLDFLVKNNFQLIQPQIRVNQNQMMAINLGPSDLWQDVHINKKKFKPADFKKLASELDRLHSLGWVHRDIKPGNIVVHPELGPVLVDLDPMGAVGKFDSAEVSTYDYLPDGHFVRDWDFFGLPYDRYVPAEFSGDGVDNCGSDQKFNAYKKDQYAFLLSVIDATLGVDCDEFRSKKIKLFTTLWKH